MDEGFQLMLMGARLTTAEILYHMPDFHDILQTYLWQEYDMAPKFPRLFGFLSFWDRTLDGKIHSVRVANTRLITPTEIKSVSVWGLN